MVTRDVLSEEIKKVPDKFLEELYDFVLFLRFKKQKEDDSIVTHVVSEASLKDWNSTEEDRAWKDL